MRRLIVFVALAVAALNRPLAGQNVTVLVYHGRGNSTGIEGYEFGQTVVSYKSAHKSLGPMTLAHPDSVCFHVRDPHVAFYRYTTASVVDTTRETLPQLTALAAVLKASIPAGAAAAVAGPDRLKQLTADSDVWVRDFVNLFGELYVTLTRVQSLVRASDNPDSGIVAAQQAVKLLPASPGADDLKAWAAAAKPAEKDAFVVSALKDFGQSLLDMRKSLQTTYGDSAPSTIDRCTPVGAGRTTAKLSIARQMDFATRDVTPLSVVVDPEYQHGFIEAFPLLLVAFARDVPTFTLSNGTIQTSTQVDARLYRPGAAAVVNVYRSGPIGVGPATLVGVGGDGKINLSDLGIGLVAAYKNLVQLGIGLGQTQAPTSLSSTAQLGGPLPQGKTLNDLIVRGDKRAWFMAIGIPGLNLKTPF